MTITGTELTWVMVCYGLGCWTAGYYWVRWRTGHDLRGHGSGNVGARNAGRVLGWTGFLVTLGGDLAKGMVAVGVARFMEMDPYVVMAAMLAVVAGHVWPLQLRFRGGKGVAVSMGALLVYDPYLCLIILLLTACGYLLLRSFTMAGLLAYGLAPLGVFLAGFGPLETFAISAIAMLVLVAHRRNIWEEVNRWWSERSGKPAAQQPPEGGVS